MSNLYNLNEYRIKKEIERMSQLGYEIVVTPKMILDVLDHQGELDISGILKALNLGSNAYSETMRIVLELEGFTELRYNYTSMTWGKVMKG